MKKNTWIVSLTSFCIVVLLISQVYRSKGEYPVSGRPLLQTFVLYETDADIDGDGLNDKITVFGKKPDETTEFATDINVSVKFSGSSFIKKTNTNILSGKVPECIIYDFTGDRKNEIMLCIPDNISLTKNTAIFDFSPSIPKNIFTAEHNKGIDITMKYANNFIINAKIANTENFSINLSKYSKALIGAGIYDQNGNPKNNSIPKLSGYISLSPYDKNGDGVYGLCGKQTITDADNTLCEVISYLEYANNQWKTHKIEYAYSSSF